MDKYLYVLGDPSVTIGENNDSHGDYKAVLRDLGLNFSLIFQNARIN